MSKNKVIFDCFGLVNNYFSLVHSFLVDINEVKYEKYI